MSAGPRFALLKPFSTQNPKHRLQTVARHFSTGTYKMAPAPVHYEMVVIGGGSGGSGTARRCAGWYKKKTAIIDDGISGGCCVNVGCVPKKITWNMASINEMIEKGKHYGYDFPKINFNFNEFVQKRHARIHQLNGIYEKNWAADGADLIKAHARFTGDKSMELTPKDGSDKYSITFDHCTIATGSWPTKPQDIKGSEHGITSDDFFSIAELPKKIVFVGAGYISVELAGVMNALGVETHMFIRGKTFLRKFDQMVQDIMTTHYEEMGVHVHREHPGIKEVQLVNPAKDETDPREKKLLLKLNDGTEMETNELLWGIGRGAETRNLGLENLSGLKTDKTGHIVVDTYQNTSVNGIYALGDVTGQAELTPVAIAAGRMLGNRLFGGPKHKDAHLDYDRIPTVVFAHPTIGTSGLSQQAAEKKYGKDKVKIYQTKFPSMFYDMFPQEEKAKNPTAFKIVCQGENEEVVGLHILGEGTDEMMQGFGVAMKMGATKADFDSCVAIHPTSAEELVTMK